MYKCEIVSFENEMIGTELLSWYTRRMQSFLPVESINVWIETQTISFHHFVSADIRTMGPLLVVIDWNNGVSRWVPTESDLNRLNYRLQSQNWGDNNMDQTNWQWTMSSGTFGEQVEIDWTRGRKERRQENNGSMSRGTPKIGGTVPNWDFGRRRSTFRRITPTANSARWLG